jgi:hypothetical protein
VKDVVLPSGQRLTLKDVQDIKDHVFMREHHMFYQDGEEVIKRFDPGIDEAEAWLRLAEGTPIDTDFLLLDHEFVELNIMKENPNLTYNEAHKQANEIADWNAAIEEKKHG